MIHDVYGEACGLGGITPVEGTDYARVGVASDGLPMEESHCVMNFAYAFFYHPDLGRAITWPTGQAASFYADLDYAELPYDVHMAESFRFISE